MRPIVNPSLCTPKHKSVSSQMPMERQVSAVGLAMKLCHVPPFPNTEGSPLKRQCAWAGKKLTTEKRTKY